MYARDVQSAPLRVLETMLRTSDWDETRSSMLRRPDDQAEQVTNLPLPVTQPAHSPDDWVRPPVGLLRGHEDAGREFADAQSAPWST